MFDANCYVTATTVDFCLTTLISGGHCRFRPGPSYNLWRLGANCCL